MSKLISSPLGNSRSKGMYISNTYLHVIINSSVNTARKSIWQIRGHKEQDLRLHQNDVSIFPFKSSSKKSSERKIFDRKIFGNKMIFKRVSSQKPGNRQKFQSKESFRKKEKHLGFNISPIHPQKRLITPEKNCDISFDPDKVFHTKNYKFLNAIQFLIKNHKGHNKAQISHLLKSYSTKACRYVTPNLQHSKVCPKRKFFIEDFTNAKFNTRKNIKKFKPVNLKKIESPYNIMTEPTTNNAKMSKMIALKLFKGENAKKYINESTDNCSTTTNKSNSLIGKYNMCDNDEYASKNSDDRLTIIEYECENNYELIYKSLKDHNLL